LTNIADYIYFIFKGSIMKEGFSPTFWLFMLAIALVFFLTIVSQCRQPEPGTLKANFHITPDSAVVISTATDTTGYLAQGIMSNLIINKFARESGNYICSYTALNHTDTFNEYKIEVEIQQQKKGSYYKKFIDGGMFSIGNINPGEQRTYKLTFPAFKRNSKSHYRIYLQLIDSTNNIEQFLDDIAVVF
jgi:hypothetical protein